VSLSGLTDSTLVVPTMAQTLGLREQGNLPFAELLREHLRERQLLLVLDNFEQVVGAAPEVAALLAAAPRLSVLVTSRVTLHLRGERDFPLAPLRLPDPDHLPPAERLAQYAAVALFVERAQAARPDFAVTAANAPAIAGICARLDGLPLALELAATRVKLLPPDALLVRLSSQLQLLTGGARDLEERQRTMRAAIAWSADLLTPEERVLFRRLAVFVGGCTLEAAEAVCGTLAGATPLELDLLDGLGALVDQSLVQQREEEGEPRFSMLHVIREYALGQLAASGEAVALQQAHLAYYLGVVEGREFSHFGQAAAVWLTRLEREHDNFRSALAWSQEQGDVEQGLRLASSLGPFWYATGYFSEGRGWLEGSLALPPALPSDQGAGARGEALARDGASTTDAPQASGMPIVPTWAPVASVLPLLPVSPATRAKSLSVVGMFAWRQGDYERAQAAAQECLVWARGRQPAWVAGSALFALGNIAWERGDLAQAAALTEEGVAVIRASGEPGLTADMSVRLGDIAVEQGDLERATALYEEALQHARRAGAEIAVSDTLLSHAALARRRGDFARAERLGREQLVVFWRLGLRRSVASCLEELACTAVVAESTAQTQRAACLLGAAASLREQMGIPPTAPWQGDVQQAVATGRAVLGKEAWEAVLVSGRALSLEEAIAEALREAS
jgi:predicted ATPase